MNFEKTCLEGMEKLKPLLAQHSATRALSDTGVNRHQGGGMGEAWKGPNGRWLFQVNPQVLPAVLGAQRAADKSWKGEHKDPEVRTGVVPFASAMLEGRFMGWPPTVHDWNTYIFGCRGIRRNSEGLPIKYDTINAYVKHVLKAIRQYSPAPPFGCYTLPAITKATLLRCKKLDAGRATKAPLVFGIHHCLLCLSTCLRLSSIPETPSTGGGAHTYSNWVHRIPLIDGYMLTLATLTVLSFARLSEMFLQPGKEPWFIIQWRNIIPCPSWHLP